MNKNQVKGMIKQTTGSVKEAWGKITGNADTEAEGKADKIEGKLQTGIGDTKEVVKDTVDKV